MQVLVLTLLILGLTASVLAFSSMGKSALVSRNTARYLFGTPEPRKEEPKKGGGLGNLGNMFGNFYSDIKIFMV